ncbi:hypothetical protein D3C87_588140 [compost metagenome]
MPTSMIETGQQTFPAEFFDYDEPSNSYVAALQELRRKCPAINIVKNERGKYVFVIVRGQHMLKFTFDYSGFIRGVDGRETIKAVCTSIGFEGVTAEIHLSPMLQ